MQPTDIEHRVTNIEKVITQMSEDAFPWVKNVPITESGYYLCKVHFEDEYNEGHLVYSGGNVDVLTNITFPDPDELEEGEVPEPTINSDDVGHFSIEDILSWIKIPNF